MIVFLAPDGQPRHRESLDRVVGTADADDQCREPEGRSRADLKWTIFRRRPVTAGVRQINNPGARCPIRALRRH